MFRVPSVLEIDTTTYARGRKSLKCTAQAGVLTSSATPIASCAIPEPSLHWEFQRIDSFDTYSALGIDRSIWYQYDVYDAAAPLASTSFPLQLEERAETASTDNGETFPFSCFARHYPLSGELADFSTFSGLSIYGKAYGDVCLYVSFMDMFEEQTEWTKFGYVPKRWGRMDASVSWGDVNSEYIEWVLYHYDCAGDTVFWLDEMVAYGSDADSKFNTWTPLFATDLETERKTQMKVVDIAGSWPSVIHRGTPDSMRGEFKFRSDFAQMDNELRFIDYCMREHIEVYFRAGVEGFPIYITSMKTQPLLQHRGVKSEVTAEFVEAV